MKNLFLLAFALLTTLILAACTGYSDGPALNFISAENKLSTSWEVTAAEMRGVDVTADFSQDFFTFEDNGDYQTLDAAQLVSLPPFTRDTLLPVLGTGTWAFRNGSRNLELYYTYRLVDPYNLSTNYEESISEFWEIARLTQEELWLRNDSMLLKMVPAQ
jgi:hypothetical protein